MQTFLDSKAIVQQKMLERQFEDTMKEEQNNGKQHVEESEIYVEESGINETHLTPFVSVR
ncbi:MAG: hypothetical protein Kow00121_31970 [Elainellaceae cyanobacterium]